MPHNQWESPGIPEFSEKPEKRELLYCPQNHENPYAWRHACAFCAKICEEETRSFRMEENKLKGDGHKAV